MLLGLIWNFSTVFQLNSNGRALGCESWGQGIEKRVSWQHCHATAQKKIRFSTPLLKGKRQRKCSYTDSSLDTLTGERILWSFSRNFFLHIEKDIPSCLACCDQKFACYTRVWVSGGVVKNQSHFIQNEPQILTTGGFTHQLVSNFGINWHLWV